MQFGASWIPAPTAGRVRACSYTRTSSPARSSATAAVSPPMPPPTTATDGATSSLPDLHDGLDPGHRSAAWSIASAVPSDHGDTVRGCATPSTTRSTRSVKKQTRSRIFGFSGIGSG